MPPPSLPSHNMQYIAQTSWIEEILTWEIHYGSFFSINLVNIAQYSFTANSLHCSLQPTGHINIQRQILYHATLQQCQSSHTNTAHSHTASIQHSKHSTPQHIHSSTGHTTRFQVNIANTSHFNTIPLSHPASQPSTSTKARPVHSDKGTEADRQGNSWQGEQGRSSQPANK